MNDYKKLNVWNKSIDLVVDVYKATEQFPSDERFGLTSQVKRSAVSMPSNIAEGAGRNSNPQFQNFLNYSNGSSCELETQLIIANKLDYLQINKLLDFQQRIEIIQKQIFNLQKSLKR